MTHQQLETVEISLSSLSALDKLELVERLVKQLRTAVTAERPGQAQPPSEAEFKRQLLASGLMSSLPLPRDTTPRPEFQPVLIEGEPLSETIIRERR